MVHRALAMCFSVTEKQQKRILLWFCCCCGYCGYYLNGRSIGVHKIIEENRWERDYVWIFLTYVCVWVLGLTNSIESKNLIVLIWFFFVRIFIKHCGNMERNFFSLSFFRVVFGINWIYLGFSWRLRCIVVWKTREIFMRKANFFENRK